MFNFKRFAMAFIGVLALCSIEARADSFVITNVSGFLAVDVPRADGFTILRTATFSLVGPGLTVSTLEQYSIGISPWTVMPSVVLLALPSSSSFQQR